MRPIVLRASAIPAAPRYDWRRQWYPIAVTDRGITDPSRPHRAKLLGDDLVLWFDAPKKTWRAFADACPHRLAPLSEGRIEKDGTLMCAYHAWKFDGTGSCTSVPQAHDQAKARSCFRARARSYPTRETHGLLWVWATVDDHDASVASAPQLIPELIAGNGYMPNPWVHRDLPYGWDFAMENLSDGSHTPVSHHGILGNRNTDALPIVYNTVEPLTDAGFSCEWDMTASTFHAFEKHVAEASFTTFRPPCLMRVDSVQKNGSRSTLALYVTPTSPGRCRFIAGNVLVRGRDGKMPRGFVLNVAPMPVWLGHIAFSFLVQQDLVFLYYQAYALENKDWRKACYMPATADKATVMFRVWFHQHGPIPWSVYPALPPRIEHRRDLFDVHSTHTQDCVHCSRALRNFELARTALAFAAAASVSHTLLLGIAFAGAAASAHVLAQFLRVVDYTHQENE